LLGELAQTRHYFRMRHGVGVRRFALNVKRASRLEYASLDIGRTIEALPVKNRMQIRARQQFFGESVRQYLAFVHQYGWLALEEFVEAAMAEQKPDHEIVDSQHRQRADEPAGERVVVSDDGVLHRIRERQQHDQIKWVQLR